MEGPKTISLSSLTHQQGLPQDLPKFALPARFYVRPLSNKAYKGENMTKNSFTVFYVCFSFPWIVPTMDMVGAKNGYTVFIPMLTWH